MITSLLDTDFYTFTVANAVHHFYPKSEVTYNFTSRRSTPVKQNFVINLAEKLKMFSNLTFSKDDIDYLYSLGVFSVEYMKKLASFKPNYLNDLEIFYDFNKPIDLKENFSLKIRCGNWVEKMIWEVPLLAMISESYYETEDLNWNMDGQKLKIEHKANVLYSANCEYSDFGTRRRRSFDIQDLVVKTLKDKPGFKGTSNVFLAKKYGVNPIGTMSHQWIMGVSALDSLRYANRNSLEKWNFLYNNSFFLTDTFGTDAFLNDFNKKYMNLYAGVRHDSGCPFGFTDRIVEHYKKNSIDPSEKTIIYSDGLDPETCVRIKNYANGKINSFFGIGTNFTNSFEDSPALNMVIKLRTVQQNPYSNEVPVVKLSDVPGKSTGDSDAVKVAKWTFYNEPLNSEK